MTFTQEDKVMSSNTIRLIACRAYAFLFGGFGFSLVLGGLMMLYWSAYGAPPEFQDALVKAHLQMDAAKLLAIVGGGVIVFGALHATLSVFASMGRLWPLVTGTVCWVLLFAPSLGAPPTYPGSHMISIVLLGTCVSLTVLAVVARYIAPTTVPSHATAVA
jgi:hypothetical protein